MTRSNIISPRFSWQWTTWRSTLQNDDCWQKSILWRWSVCMEQSSYISERRIAYPGL